MKNDHYYQYKNMYSEYYVSIPRKREWFFILIKDCRISGVGLGSGIFKAE